MDLLNDQRTIQIGDRLVYQVIEEREPPVVVFVNDRGKIDIPLLGQVEAKGNTCKNLAYELKERLEDAYFHRATVLLKHQYSDNSRGRVTVVGHVARPGPYPIPSDAILTVSELITRTGGFLPGADRENVTIKRPDTETEDTYTEIEVDVKAVLEEGLLSQDKVVKPEDIVVVDRLDRILGSYIVTGLVTSPGDYNLPADGSPMTVSQAILKAGGFAKFANKDKVILIRENPENPEKPLRFTVDVQKVLEEGVRTGDMELQADDIIRVKEVIFAF